MLVSYPEFDTTAKPSYLRLPQNSDHGPVGYTILPKIMTALHLTLLYGLVVKVFLMLLCFLTFPTKLHSYYALTFRSGSLRTVKFYHGCLGGPSSEAF